MAASGHQTVTISSGGAFADPAAPLAVTVLPTLRVTGHVGASPAGYDTSNASFVGNLFVQPVQGRAHLMFRQGETVGFHVPFQIYGVRPRANAWEVYDFSGHLVDSGTCDVNISATGKSDTICCPGVTLPGAYRLYLYDTTVAAGSVDFVNVSSFVVLANSRSGLPFVALSTANQYAYQSGARFELMSNAVPTTSEGSLNGYAPAPSQIHLVRRAFSFTPASTITGTIARNNARITVAGQVTQPFTHFPQFGDNQDKYTAAAQTFRAGTAYTVTVENFLPRNQPLPPVQFSSGAALGGVRSTAGTANAVTINDYPAFLTDSSGDHNDTGIRACLGEAGSLTRYQVTNTSQAGDFANAIAFEKGAVLGNLDPARERRRIIFNFVDLLTVQQQADAGHATLNTYSTAGITSFINGVIALGMDPADFVVEGANEPQSGDASY